MFVSHPLEISSEFGVCLGVIGTFAACDDFGVHLAFAAFAAFALRFALLLVCVRLLCVRLLCGLLCLFAFVCGWLCYNILTSKISFYIL
jgi:ABC-type thiamin/hydroxymethylpyrimidine transport system permease subunit